MKKSLKWLISAAAVTALLFLNFGLFTAYAESPSVDIDIETVSASGAGYTYTGNIVTITEAGTYVFTGSSTTNRIKVNSGVAADITLRDVSINVSGFGYPYACAFNMSGAAVNLTLTGINTLKSGINYAGLQVPANSTLAVTVASTGSLISTGGRYGAGIGGGRSSSGGTINIAGGEVTAYGGESGAGIGGGSEGASGDIVISGSKVTAVGGADASGIGQGAFSGGSGTVSISGGTVNATGGNNGSGIGGGYYSPSGTITISAAAVVTAKGGSYGAGIGSGCNGDTGSIIIQGGNTQATGGIYGMGIGAGNYGSIGSIVIGSGDIFAYGGESAAGIGCGGGFGDPVGTVTVTGGTTYAKGGNRGAGLGTGWGDAGCTITINDGKMTAEGGSGGAGIGGGYDAGSVCNVTVNGGIVIAKGGFSGAGIGGGQGDNSICGSVTITGGNVSAFGGIYSAGIGGGGGTYLTACGNISISGSGTIVNAYGDSGLSVYDIGSGKQLGYATSVGGTLRVDGGANVNLNRNNTNSSTNFITCKIGGAGAGPNEGIYFYGQRVNGIIDLSAPGTGSLCGTGYTYSDNVVSVNVNGSYGVTGSTDTNSMAVVSGVAANILMRNVSIDMSANDNRGAFEIAGATVNLTLNGANTLAGGLYRPGLGVSDTANLTITAASSGSLTAAGGTYAAGIGGGSAESCGTVTILGANTVVNAAGGTDASDIGSGDGVINVGTLTADGSARVNLDRFGTDTTTYLITCKIGGAGAGLLAGDYLNSRKLLTLSGFAADPSGGTIAFNSITHTVNINGISFADPGGHISILANGTEIATASVTRLGIVSNGTAVVTWDTVPGQIYTFTAKYVPAVSDSYYVTGEVQIAGYVVTQITPASLLAVIPVSTTYGDLPFDIDVSGGSGTGLLSYEVTSGNAVTVDSNGEVTIRKAGPAEITITKAADNNYYSTSVKVTLEVEKAAPPTLVFPTAGAITYEQSLSDSVLSSGIGDGTYSWKIPEIQPTVSNPGYLAVFTPDDTDNYDYTGVEFEQIVSVTVNKATPAVTFPTSGVITYGMSLSDSVLSGGTGDGNFAWKTPAVVPSILNSGYAAVFTPGDMANYLPTEQTVSIYVNKAEQAELSVSDIPGIITYGEPSFSITGSGGSGSGLLSFKVTFGDSVKVDSYGQVTIIKSGDAEITVTKEADGNYNISSASAVFSVGKATPPAITFPTSGGISYGQDLSASGLSGGAGDGTFAWKNPDTVPTVQNTGCAVVFTPNDTDNYDYSDMILEQIISVTVSKVLPPPVIFPASSAIIYEEKLSESALSAGSGDGNFNWKSPATVPTVLNVGYIVEFTPRDSDNYDYSGVVLEQIVDVEVGKATPEVSFPTSAAIAYGQTLSNSSLSGGSDNGSFAWMSPDTVPPVLNDGYTVLFTPYDVDNYDYSSVEMEQSVNVRWANRCRML